MVDAARSPGRLEVFRTLREGLSLLPRAIGPYLRLALAAIGLYLLLLLVLYLFPYTLWRLVLPVLEIGGLTGDFGVPIPQGLPSAASLLSTIIQVYVTLCLVVAQYRLAAEIRAGTQPRVREVFARPGPPLVTLLGLALVLVVGTSVGLMALVIPGVLFVLLFGQALPAMIFEGTNIRGSLALSLALTRGNRMKILGVALILMSLTLVPFLLGYLVRQVEGPDVSLLVVLPMIAVTLILFFLLSCLWPLVALILYQDLRALKDGSRVPAPEVSGAA